MDASVLFNYLFKWRRYPAYLTSRNGKSTSAADAYGPINHADLAYALSEMDSFIDITEEDLLRIYRLAIDRNSGAYVESSK